VFAEDRHLDARGRLHFCLDCKRYFVSWNPDSMAFYPKYIQLAYASKVWFGRKTAFVRSLVDRCVQAAPLGASLGQIAAEKNEREVHTWRRHQAFHDSANSFDRQYRLHPQGIRQYATGQTQAIAAWPAFDSERYGGRLLTAQHLQTMVGQILAAEIHRITLKVQSLSGEYLASDDAFKVDGAGSHTKEESSTKATAATASPGGGSGAMRTHLIGDL